MNEKHMEEILDHKNLPSITKNIAQKKAKKKQPEKLLKRKISNESNNGL